MRKRRKVKKGISPVVGVILLILLAVAAVGIVTVLMSGLPQPVSPPSAQITSSDIFSPGNDENGTVWENVTTFKFTHMGGTDELNAEDLNFFVTGTIKNNATGEGRWVEYSVEGLSLAGSSVEAATLEGKWGDDVWVSMWPTRVAVGEIFYIKFNFGRAGANAKFTVVDRVSFVHNPSDSLLLEEPHPTVTELPVTPPPPPPPPEWWDTSWNYKKKITIDHTKVENENFTDFPVLISITDTDLQSHVGFDNGQDIAFVNPNEGTQLDHETENYDNSTGKLVAWVRIPTLYDNEDTIIYMYYGNPSASNQGNAEGVWDDNFMMVQHLHETEELADNDHFDSTSNNNDGESYITPVDNMNAAGKINEADNFDGVDDYVRVSDSLSLRLGSGDFTIESWIKLEPKSFYKGYVHMIVDKSDEITWETYSFYVNMHGKLSLWVDDSSQDSPWAFGATTLDFDTWYHVAGVKSGNMLSVYLEGNLDGGPTQMEGTGNYDCEYDLVIGGSPWFWSGWRFNGTIDEVRISNRARSSSWILTAFNNENDPSTFYSVGGEEAV